MFLLETVPANWPVLVDAKLTMQDCRSWGTMMVSIVLRSFASGRGDTFYTKFRMHMMYCCTLLTFVLIVVDSTINMIFNQ